jgi:hypothetical protein
MVGKALVISVGVLVDRFRPIPILPVSIVLWRIALLWGRSRTALISCS